VPRTEGFSGAELAALCREAGMQAIQRGLARSIAPRRLAVTRQDVGRALAPGSTNEQSGLKNLRS
jgi:SpoVK/Ycf46/Vps4 family AAA+-type ATPase